MIDPQDILSNAEAWAMEAEKRANDGDTLERVQIATAVSRAFSAVALARFMPIHEIEGVALAVKQMGN